MAFPQLNKEKFVVLLNDWHSHSVYDPGSIAVQLAECGLKVCVSEDKKTLFIESMQISVAEPEWGDPGISPLSILCAVYELTTGGRPESRMTGQGFRYRDISKKLAKHWGITGNDA